MKMDEHPSPPVMRALDRLQEALRQRTLERDEARAEAVKWRTRTSNALNLPLMYCQVLPWASDLGMTPNGATSNHATQGMAGQGMAGHGRAWQRTTNVLPPSRARLAATNCSPF